MNKDIIILFLLLVIASLLGIISYLLVTDEPKKKKKAPDPCQPFPADETLADIRKDFERLSFTWEPPEESSGSMPAKERTLPYIPPKPEPEKKKFAFKPRKKPISLTPKWKQPEREGRDGGRE